MSETTTNPYNSTDDSEFHEHYPAPQKQVSWKKVAITGAAIGLTVAGYQYGHQQGYEQHQQEETQQCLD